ncbi:hypothetical protein BR93DRAFT_362605 [Coniochaeta sp. PMI_546]|nr:hypothetical protein BR93DRAFT_362605 [Coniochaeta sp. PMI_546]
MSNRDNGLRKMLNLKPPRDGYPKAIPKRRNLYLSAHQLRPSDDCGFKKKSGTDLPFHGYRKKTDGKALRLMWSRIHSSGVAYVTSNCLSLPSPEPPSIMAARSPSAVKRTAPESPRAENAERLIDWTGQCREFTCWPFKFSLVTLVIWLP